MSFWVHIDIQRDRHTLRHTDRQTDRHRHTEMKPIKCSDKYCIITSVSLSTHRHTETDRETYTQTQTDTDTETDRHRQTDRHRYTDTQRWNRSRALTSIVLSPVSLWPHRQTERQIHRHINKHAHKRTETHTYAWIESWDRGQSWQVSSELPHPTHHCLQHSTVHIHSSIATHSDINSIITKQCYYNNNNNNSDNF